MKIPNEGLWLRGNTWLTKVEAEAVIDLGIYEVIEWIKKHQLVEPDSNSITQFHPFYQIKERELEEWSKKKEG